MTWHAGGSRVRECWGCVTGGGVGRARARQFGCKLCCEQNLGVGAVISARGGVSNREARGARGTEESMGPARLTQNIDT